MTSVQPTEQTLLRSLTADSVPTSLIRFNSARILPEKTEDEVENLVEPPPTSPTDLHIDEALLQSPSFIRKIHPTSRVSPFVNDNDGKRVVKASEYHSPTSIIRFNSARIEPGKTENNIVNSIESPPTSPTSLHLQFDEGSIPPLSPSIKHKRHLSARITPFTNENDSNRVVKISEYHAPDNTPFEPVTPKTSPKKLHHYILVPPRTLFSISLFTILSIAVVLIGFGVATARRQSDLNTHCPSISYCPQNKSYTVLCNMTNEYCQCYNTEDTLIGCLKQRRYNEGCYRTQECSIHHNLQCNTSIYQCQCLDHYYYNGSSCIPMLTYGELCSISNNKCDYSLNLTCLNGNICTCNTNVTFWNGQYCELYRSVNNPCDPYKTPSGCSMTFICANTTATCQCPSSYYYNGKVCLSYSSYLEPCYDTSSCLPNTQLICSYGLCQCDDLYYYWSPTYSACIYPKQIVYNSSCDYQTGCESDFGLRCINGRCLCEVNSYWTPGNYCDFQSQYNEQCLTAPCLGNTGLLCSSNTSICTCPQCKLVIFKAKNLFLKFLFRLLLG